MNNFRSQHDITEMTNDNKPKYCVVAKITTSEVNVDRIDNIFVEDAEDGYVYLWAYNDGGWSNRQEAVNYSISVLYNASASTERNNVSRSDQTGILSRRKPDRSTTRNTRKVDQVVQTDQQVNTDPEPQPQFVEGQIPKRKRKRPITDQESSPKPQEKPPVMEQKTKREQPDKQAMEYIKQCLSLQDVLYDQE